MFEQLSKLFKREIQKNETELDKYVEFWKSILNTFPKQVIKKLHDTISLGKIFSGGKKRCVIASCV